MNDNNLSFIGPSNQFINSYFKKIVQLIVVAIRKKINYLFVLQTENSTINNLQFNIFISTNTIRSKIKIATIVNYFQNICGSNEFLLRPLKIRLLLDSYSVLFFFYQTGN